MKRKPSIQYVNNAEFYDRIVEWKNSGEEQIPDDIAMTLVKICQNLSRSGKFVGYSWRSEMIEDAIVSCIRFARNFDPSKGKNPFAFYTAIAYNAFVKRIQIEKQKLAMMAEYRDQMRMLYDLPFDDEDDGRYANIENTAKRINRTYIKPSKEKSKKSKTVKKESAQEIETFF